MEISEISRRETETCERSGDIIKNFKQKLNNTWYEKQRGRGKIHMRERGGVDASQILHAVLNTKEGIRGIF